MIVFRLANKKYSKDLSGKGAELTGGRWNYKGTRILYTSNSRALCMSEIAIHTPIGIMPVNYYLVKIEIPDCPDIPTIESKNLPKNWIRFPHSKETQKLGNQFIIDNKSLYIKVPSAVVQGDYNILINPSHPEFHKVQIIKTEKFDFDERLFR